MTTKSRRLYQSNGGVVTCAAHGGAYLESALMADPDARRIVTPLDVWERLTVAEVAEWTNYTDGAPCDGNRYGTGGACAP
jgi:hypothetical protein